MQSHCRLYQSEACFELTFEGAGLNPNMGQQSGLIQASTVIIAAKPKVTIKENILTNIVSYCKWVSGSMLLLIYTCRKHAMLCVAAVNESGREHASFFDLEECYLGPQRLNPRLLL